jgi:diacylglycerol kinase family enzyme
VGNNAYAIKAGQLGRRESLNTGLLSVCIVPGRKRIAMLRFLAAALAGRAQQADELECFNVSSLTVNTRKKHLRVAFDGEIRRMRTPLRYVARPGALQVIAPETEAR